jgi:cysteinyl-tRNA synthetase
LARYWLHNGRLNIDGAEMHKSEGNALFVKDLPGDKRAFRLFLLSTHYRAPINFRYDSLQVVETEWKKLEKTVRSLYRTSELSHDLTPVSSQHKAIIDGYREKFNEAMDLDFNTPNAITALLGLVKQGNLFLKHPASAPTLQLMGTAIQSLLEILGTPVSIKPLQPDEAALIAEWNECRAKKDFAKADILRQELQKRDLL